jgi:simple sugar transport system permease protein
VTDETQGAEDQAAPVAPPDPDSNDRKKTFFSNLTGVGGDWISLYVVPLLAIVTALLIGGIIIVFSDLDTLRQFSDSPGETISATFTNVVDAYRSLLTGAFGSPKAWSETLTRSAPLILAGLAVAIGFQAGLFNIGANGQILMGGMFALVVGFSFSLPGIIHIPLVIIGGLIGGAIWGAIPGYLRARTGAHEVITTIMLNFIALKLVDYWLTVEFFQLAGRDDPVSKSVEATARYPKLLAWFESSLRLHLGIVIAIAAAIFIWWLLYRSTLGFQFRAVGANPDAARYAGMNVAFLTIAVMAIAGSMAGLAGADQVTGTLGRATPGFAGVIGFDAIALALLARSNPIGVIFAGILFGGLAAGGQAMQASTTVGIDIVTVIQALIIVFIAAPALIRSMWRLPAPTKEEAVQVTKGWAT